MYEFCCKGSITYPEKITNLVDRDNYETVKINPVSRVEALTERTLKQDVKNILYNVIHDITAIIIVHQCCSVLRASQGSQAVGAS